MSATTGMRVAALYDVHGNLPALEAVLEAVREAAVDLVVVGGDILPGPMPGECLSRLLELGIETRFLHGNGDRAARELHAGGESDWYRSAPEPGREAVRWSAEQLDPAQRDEIAGWPPTVRLEIPGLGRVLFCHATPENDTDIFTRSTPESRLRPVFDRADANLVACGHTHMQFDRRVGATRVVNAGSVGMPFVAPGAFWLRLGPQIELRRTAYDLDAAAERIRTTAYPQARQLADCIVEPPSEQEVLARFGQAEPRSS